MRSELEERLRVAEEAVRGAEAKEEERAQLAELERRVRAAEIRARDLPKWLELVDEYGEDKVAKIESDIGWVVVKRPHENTYRKFVDSKLKTEDMIRFVQPCVVYPDKARFHEMRGDLPALLQGCADACAHLAGVRRQEVSGK